MGSILHIDMDAFYASVEERDRPELRGKPLIVGGTPEGRGVVAAANYAVRRFGVYSAMPTSTALKRCPHAIVLRPRMSHYSDVSREIHVICSRYTPLIEPLSLDEAFLDVSGSQAIFGSAEQIGRSIKHDIANELQLVASVGVAPNKFLAKLSSDLDKPDGFVVVPENSIEAFLDPLPVGRIWGVGRVAEERLLAIGVRTVGQLRAQSLETLTKRFGKSGEQFWRLARGLDDRAVVADRQAKSISHETTFAHDVDDTHVLEACLLELTEQVARRMRSNDLRGRTIQLKLRYSDFHTITRSQTVQKPTQATDFIWQIALGLLRKEAKAKRPLLLRLLGVGVSNFGPAKPVQRGLFEESTENPGGGAGDREAQEDQELSTRLDAVSDQIKEKFGMDALRRAMTVRKDEDQGQRS